jgi:ComF family protein
MKIQQWLDLIMPPRCYGCRDPLANSATHWCVVCEPTLLDADPGCKRCARPAPGAGIPMNFVCRSCIERPPPLQRIMCAMEYGGALRQAILQAKYEKRSHLCRGLAQLWTGAEHESDWDLVVPVPLHRRRLRRRGYNQAALIAQHLGNHVKARVTIGALIRTRQTLPQVGLSAAAREENVRGAFACSKRHRFAGTRILLVDDVMTTGATLRACAKALRRAGAQSVDAWVVARDR